MTTAASDLHRLHHPHCVVCSADRRPGLNLAFVAGADGSVMADLACSAEWEGYAGLVHGGVIATALDGAMTHCLFQHGHVAVTAELAVRYRHPVLLGAAAQVRAWLVRATPPVYRLQAELVQEGVRKATAQATFFQRPLTADPGRLVALDRPRASMPQEARCRRA